MKDEKLHDLFGSWYPTIKDFGQKPAFDNILAQLVHDVNNQQEITPDLKNIFTAFKECNFNDTLVIWVGLSPYHNGEATGISMGIPDNWDKEPPPTLRVIMEELNYEYGRPADKIDLTLKSWCNQGMLMINRALTTKNKDPRSHVALWTPFIRHFFKYINDNTSGLIIVLLGKEAKEITTILDSNRFHILKYVHPAAEAYNSGTAGFYRCGIFKAINSILKDTYNKEIDWFCNQPEPPLNPT